MCLLGKVRTVGSFLQFSFVGALIAPFFLHKKNAPLRGVLYFYKPFDQNLKVVITTVPNLSSLSLS